MSAVVFAHNSQSLLIALSRLNATQQRFYAPLSLFCALFSIETATTRSYGGILEGHVEVIPLYF